MDPNFVLTFHSLANGGAEESRLNQSDLHGLLIPGLRSAHRPELGSRCGAVSYSCMSVGCIRWDTTLCRHSGALPGSFNGEVGVLKGILQEWLLSRQTTVYIEIGQRIVLVLVGYGVRPI